MLVTTYYMQGCPLGVRHLFCLFDGHGGDSVAEFCRSHLADRVVRRVREAHATRSAAATAAAIAAGSAEEPDGKSSRPRGGSQRFGDGGGRGRGGEAAAEAALVAVCIREACREVDAEVSREIYGRPAKEPFFFFLFHGAGG